MAPRQKFMISGMFLLGGLYGNTLLLSYITVLANVDSVCIASGPLSFLSYFSSFMLYFEPEKISGS